MVKDIKENHTETRNINDELRERERRKSNKMEKA
jgi:hypothetical protein